MSEKNRRFKIEEAQKQSWLSIAAVWRSAICLALMKASLNSQPALPAVLAPYWWHSGC